MCISNHIGEKKNYLKISISVIVIIPLMILLSSFKEIDYCRLADIVVSKYEKEFAKPKGLVLNGEGGAMMDDIQSITLKFSVCKELSIEEFRILYVEMMEEFLRRINNDKKIRPFLHTFPFSIDNIQLTISCKDEKGRTRDDGGMAFMFLGNRQEIAYHSYDSNKKDFCDLHREPYAVARDLVLSKSQVQEKE